MHFAGNPIFMYSCSSSSKSCKCTHAIVHFFLQMYDKDASGTIELTEMMEVIGTLYDMEGVTTSGGEGNEQRANRIFAELDINGDGELTMEEFVRGCMQDKDLVRMLSAGGLHADEAEADDHY